VIKNVHFLEKIEKDLILKNKLSYEQSLKIFESMWKEGIKLGILPLKDPSDGLEVDLKIAKILNSCLKKSFQK
jgi:hypothetical protein